MDNNYIYKAKIKNDKFINHEKDYNNQIYFYKKKENWVALVFHIFQYLDQNKEKEEEQIKENKKEKIKQNKKKRIKENEEKNIKENKEKNIRENEEETPKKMKKKKMRYEHKGKTYQKTHLYKS